MTEDTPAPTGRFTSEIFLGTLVALLSILTAVLAYHSSVTGAAAAGHELNGIRALTESNTEYITANQNILFDFRQFDSWVLATDTDSADFIESGFSAELTEGLQRESGPFDETYFDQQFASSDEKYTQALDTFEQGSATGQLADRLQLAMLIFAISLSFAAWASLARVRTRLRQMFSIFALGGLGLGLLTYVIVLGLHLWQVL